MARSSENPISTSCRVLSAGTGGMKNVSSCCGTGAGVAGGVAGVAGVVVVVLVVVVVTAGVEGAAGAPVCPISCRNIISKACGVSAASPVVGDPIGGLIVGWVGCGTWICTGGVAGAGIVVGVVAVVVGTAGVLGS